MLGYKTNLSKLKKTEIIPSVLSNQNVLKLEIKNRRKMRKFTIMWQLNNTFLNNQLVKKEIIREVKSIITNKNGNTAY